MVSNNINKPVKRFTIPRVLIAFALILILLPVGLLFHYISLNEELLLTNTDLNEELFESNSSKYQLSLKVDQLIDEREQVIDRYFELDEIEQIIHRHINDLPDEALGGIEIPFESNDLISLETVPADELLLTSSWVDRYHQTIASMDQLETNLTYIPTHGRQSRTKSHHNLDREVIRLIALGRFILESMSVVKLEPPFMQLQTAQYN